MSFRLYHLLAVHAITHDENEGRLYKKKMVGETMLTYQGGLDTLSIIVIDATFCITNGTLSSISSFGL
jgi:hypothetical protein